MTYDDLLENFACLTDWEDKYRYLIELGDALPAFSEADKTPAHFVAGCQSQVWLTHRREGDAHFFNATGDAHIVRGLAAILLILVNGKTTAQIQSLDLAEAFKKLGLLEHLSPMRRNGFTALIQHIQKLTRESK